MPPTGQNSTYLNCADFPSHLSEPIAQSEVEELEAAPPTTEDTTTDELAPQIWTKFEVSEIIALLNEMDLTTEIIDVDDGTSFIQATNSNGHNFFVNPRLCGDDGGDCLGLNTYSVFDTVPTAEKLTALNERYAYMKFYSSSDSELILQKYFTADYGIARENVKVNFMTYVDILDSFQDVLNE